MAAARPLGRTGALVIVTVASVALAACGRGPAPGSAARDPVVPSVPSGVVSGPAVPTAGASLPSGLPSDPGAADPVTPLPAGSTLSPEAAAGDLDTVILAAGVRQHLRCAGTGAPTVVVVPGLGVAAADWSAPVDTLAQRTRTCVYERPGLGLSPARTSPLQVVDAGVNARELATLLSVAGQQGPFTLVGQGYGALVARAFTRLYPASVRSLVLAGTAPARTATQVFWTEAGHRVDIAASLRTAGRTPTGTASLDVVVLRTDDPASVTAAVPT